MKILLINTVPTDRNGITNVMFNYLRAINTDHITFDLVAINQPSDYYMNEVERRGGKVFVLSRHGGIFAYLNDLRKLVRKNNYDAIHVHGNSHTTVLELIAAWAAGCKVRIVHAHSTSCKYSMIHRLLTIPFRALCTNGLACGEDAGRFMFNSMSFMVLNNGVDTDKYAFSPIIREDVRAKLAINDNEIVIGHIGYFKPVKNQTFLIDLFHELHALNNRYRLLLIGDGPQRAEIENKIMSIGLGEFIKLTGSINNVNDYLNAIDIIVMPSLFEGLPLSLIEQQANGLHCVVSDSITPEADKTDSMTFLSLQAPMKEWTTAIKGILSLKEGRSVRSQTNIKKIAECGYSIQEEARKLNDYYINAIKGNNYE